METDIIKIILCITHVLVEGRAQCGRTRVSDVLASVISENGTNMLGSPSFYSFVDWLNDSKQVWNQLRSEIRANRQITKRRKRL